MKFKTFITFLFAGLMSFVPFAASAGAATWAVHNLSAKDGKFQFTVTSISCGTKTYSSPGGYSSQTAQGVYCRIGLTVKNIGKKSQMLEESTQTLNSYSGTQYSADTEADIYLNSNGMWAFKSLNPGLQLSGYLFFDVPKGTRIASLSVHDSAFSGGATLNLKSVGAHS